MKLILIDMLHQNYIGMKRRLGFYINQNLNQFKTKTFFPRSIERKKKYQMVINIATKMITKKKKKKKKRKKKNPKKNKKKKKKKKNWTMTYLRIIFLNKNDSTINVRENFRAI